MPLSQRVAQRGPPSQTPEIHTPISEALSPLVLLPRGTSICSFQQIPTKIISQCEQDGEHTLEISALLAL